MFEFQLAACATTTCLTPAPSWASARTGKNMQAAVIAINPTARSWHPNWTFSFDKKLWDCIVWRIFIKSEIQPCRLAGFQVLGVFCLSSDRQGFFVFEREPPERRRVRSGPQPFANNENRRSPRTPKETLIHDAPQRFGERRGLNDKDSLRVLQDPAV